MILVIGYGNTLREDDGAGHALADVIGQVCRQHGLEATVIKSHQLTPEMAAEIGHPEVEAVLFSDTRVALPTDTEAGVAIMPLKAEVANPSSGHQLNPATLLLYAGALFAHQPPGWLITAPGYHFGHGESLSHKTRQALVNTGPVVATLLTETILIRP